MQLFFSLLHLLQSLSIILQLGFHDHAALQIIPNVKKKWFKDLICSLSTMPLLLLLLLLLEFLVLLRVLCALLEELTTHRLQ